MAVKQSLRALESLAAVGKRRFHGGNVFPVSHVTPEEPLVPQLHQNSRLCRDSTLVFTPRDRGGSLEWPSL